MPIRLILDKAERSTPADVRSNTAHMVSDAKDGDLPLHHRAIQ